MAVSTIEIEGGDRHVPQHHRQAGADGGVRACFVEVEAERTGAVRRGRAEVHLERIRHHRAQDGVRSGRSPRRGVVRDGACARQCGGDHGIDCETAHRGDVAVDHPVAVVPARGIRQTRLRIGAAVDEFDRRGADVERGGSRLARCYQR